MLLILKRHRFWVRLIKTISRARNHMNLLMTLGRIIFRSLRKKRLKCLKFKR